MKSLSQASVLIALLWGIFGLLHHMKNNHLELYSGCFCQLALQEIAKTSFELSFVVGNLKPEENITSSPYAETVVPKLRNPLGVTGCPESLTTWLIYLDPPQRTVPILFDPSTWLVWINAAHFFLPRD